jgi:glycosyltransferase involved in cell wall biosynthesis
MDTDSSKKIEAAEYRANILEAELNAVTHSKAYKIAKGLGMVKNQLQSDPSGLAKKATRILFKEPKKLVHIVRSGKRSAFIAQSVVEQTNKYQEWILLNEPTQAELDAQRTHSESFGYKPLISIITPVYNPPVDVLEELIETVLDQTYPYFELCLGDDYGKSEEVIALLKKYQDMDSRVRFFPFTDNKGIAGASNRLLEEVKGDYIALLDHDDTLSLDALYENAKMLNQKKYDFLYSDKDKIDTEGNRFDPLFKPEASPEMMLNVNYPTHLNVMRTRIVKQVGGWDLTTNGAQDWDLFLKVMHESKLVGHIPRILYHWRVIESSTALSIETKPYALAGQRKAVDNYLIAEKIPAKTYHEKTELLLSWDQQSIDQSPLVFIQYTNLTDTLRTIRSIRKVAASPWFAILTDETISASQAASIVEHTKSKVLPCRNDTMIMAVVDYCESIAKKKKAGTVLIIKDFVRLSKKADWYSILTGWLAIKGVGAVSGRIVDRHDKIVDSSGVITPDLKYYPIFHGFPRYYQSYLGNVEWVRNVSAISSNYCALKLSSIHDYAALGKKPGTSFDDYIFWLTNKKRIVSSPQAIASIYEDTGINPIRDFGPLQRQKIANYQDKYGNVNMSKSDPLRLFEDESLAGINVPVSAPIDSYQHDALILTSTFDIDHNALVANKKIIADNGLLKNPESVAWLLPSFDALYAGLMNIFHFANFLSDKKDLTTTVYILKDRADASDEKKLVVAKFPHLASATFVGIQPDQADRIGNHDIGIATQWATAFPLAKVQTIKRKCYFIQDNEANFYPKGSISSLVELSYEFGFMAIANTEGLLKLYRDTHGGNGIVLKSVVNLDAYHPRDDRHYIPKKPYKVFFYARPGMPRNAFELGVAGLKKLKQQLGSDVEIITAGAVWDPTAYGVQGMFTNLGLIRYDSVPKLYRSVDAGLMFMFSGHPGVTASELMASGCPVVVNEYDDVTWHELYKDEETCLVTKATASEVARNLLRCLEDTKLRKKLIDGGLKKVEEFYVDYEKSQYETFNAIIKGRDDTRQ